ncbi:AMP-binding protein [Flavobacterium sp. Fl-318]|uniref:AMP-binding protein n=1 Tax=Flavobacterium cupriresistens TaxID=2893885 RepID=A0ABU4RAT0_9FLAO|nr:MULTISPECIES: AMP-binding protein [unclassified Flavobacterium]MDX6189697.1 AMP-binding protein [Flavobacterium sp. Fl-318]UFH40897.1 AMP-binding protein [Flavobacterium sp. F-323]
MEKSHPKLAPNKSDHQTIEEDCVCLIDFLIEGSIKCPNKIVFSDVDSTLHEAPLTYSEFLFQVQTQAQIFKSKDVKKGDRCLLIFDQGIEFIIAFFACQWIGAIPVPLNMPGRLKPLDKWENIAKECHPKAIATSEKSASRLIQSIGRSELLNGTSLIKVKITAADQSETHFTAQPDIHPTAFLQYTSGSTGNPKGVVVTQDSLIQNSKGSKNDMNFTSESVLVSWLPFYHDMGLILFIVQTIYNGSTLYLMRPEDFMSKPLNWVNALSKWKATHTGGPNFAYQLVADKLVQLHNELKATNATTEISLKNLKVCASGAEPIRFQTICNFQNAISLFGASNHVISPGYGLAEATLTVSVIKEGEKVKWLKVDKEALKNNTVILQESGFMETGQDFHEEEGAVYLVANGQVIDNHDINIIAISDLETALPDSISKLKTQSPYAIGELWFSGPSVTNGYYENEKATSESYFNSSSDNTTYLRTGDLAFKDDEGQIYIVGRIKDLIIIRGLNYYPQDLERSSYYSHPDLRIDGAAAFSMNKQGNECCYIVQELTRNAVLSPKFDEYTKAIRTAVLKEHGIAIEAILFVSPMHVPRTTSGKIQRRLAKRTTELEEWPNILHASHLGATVSKKESDSAQTDLQEQLLQQITGELQHFLQTRVDSYTIDERRTIPPYIMTEFARMGLMGLMVSSQYGGLGFNLSQTSRFIEIISSADLTLGLFVSLHNVLGLHPIARFAKEEIKEKVVRELATGIGTASFALTEPGAGSNPNAGKTFAQKQPDGNWILNGEKCWVGSSSWASYLTVIAHTEDQNGKYLGQSAFLVPQGTPGLSHIEECMTMGMRGSVQGHFVLNDVSIPESHILGEIGKGAEILQEVVSMGRIGINSMCIGILKTVLSRSKRWAENRKINSGYLIDQPVVLKQLNQLLSVLEIIETYQSKLLKWKDQGLLLPDMLISAGKVFSTEETWKGVDFLMQITAARGYSEHNGISQLFRDARVLRIFEGPSESLIADLGGRSDETISETLNFLIMQDVAINAKIQIEKIQLVKQQFEPNKVGYDGQHDLQKNRKFAKYAFGEVLACQLILWMCGDDISSQAKKWIEKKITTLTADALEFDTSLLVKQQFEAQFNHLLKDHQTIYTQPALTDSAMRSPFRDLRTIETQNFIQQTEDEGYIKNNTTSKAPLFANSASAVTQSTPQVLLKNKAIKEMESWIYNWLEKEAEIESGHFASTTSFSEYGLDSSLSIRFISDINSCYAIHIEPSIIWSYSTVSELATYLCEFEIKPSELTVIKENEENGVDDAFLKGLLEDEIK